MPAHPDDLDRARVESRQLPMFARDLRTVAAGIHLNWSEARRLWAAGFLSFDPDSGMVSDEAREAEFVFVGVLAAAGLSDVALGRMLSGLRKPYAYDLGRIFYDWFARRWFLLPDEDDPEAAFLGMLSRLGDRRERQTLLEIRELVENALDLTLSRHHLLNHERHLFDDSGPTRGSKSSPSHRPERDGGFGPR